MSESSSNSDLPPIRWDQDVSGLRAIARFRLIAGLLVVASASLAISFGPVGIGGYACIGVSLLAAIAWFVVGTRALRRADRNPEALEIDSRGMTLVSGSSRDQVPWNHVTAVEVDEDRLVVRVGCKERESIFVQPIYGRQGIHQLAETLDQYWRTATP